MRRFKSSNALFVLFCAFSLGACSTYSSQASPPTNINEFPVYAQNSPPPDYAARLPQHIHTTEKVVVVDPKVHAWGAYDANGDLVRGGLASAGADWCPDLHRRCHTSVGTFRVFSLGSEGCKSSIFPIPHGGAPMPYCMFFNRNQALHGSPPGHVVDGNVSHGCVRLHVDDAEWLRFNFVQMGTKVIVRPYS